MRIAILTCHNVYNCGASLQAYALQEYLRRKGHDARIIDYVPPYLQRYSLTAVRNKKYDRPLIKQAYILAKLPGRIVRLFSKEKKNFDVFTSKNLVLSSRHYTCMDDFESPDDFRPDIWLAGSDQIWNPLFKNGRDPVFFFGFVKGGRKYSYAASIGTHDFSNETFRKNLELLQSFNAVSVRENGSICDLRKHGIESVFSCDPVFLHSQVFWESIIKDVPHKSGYVFSYTFSNPSLQKHVSSLPGLPVVDYFTLKEKNRGPLQFLSYIYHSDVVVVNSFHAAAFAIIFHKDFYVLQREDENLNMRLSDMLLNLGLMDRYITSEEKADTAGPIDWDAVDAALKQITDMSKKYIERIS